MCIYLCGMYVPVRVCLFVFRAVIHTRWREKSILVKHLRKVKEQKNLFIYSDEGINEPLTRSLQTMLAVAAAVVVVVFVVAGSHLKRSNSTSNITLLNSCITFDLGM